MSAAKHTPGPWFVGAQNDYLYVIDRRPSASGNDYPNHEADTELVAKLRRASMQPDENYGPGSGSGPGSGPGSGDGYGYGDGDGS